MTCNPFKARAWIVRRYDYILLLHEAEPTLENALKYDELAQEYHKTFKRYLTDDLRAWFSEDK